ncbi:hypothetical protein CR513_11395, partial [Mucuna pruriens]
MTSHNDKTKITKPFPFQKPHIYTVSFFQWHHHFSFSLSALSFSRLFYYYLCCLKKNMGECSTATTRFTSSEVQDDHAPL